MDVIGKHDHKRTYNQLGTLGGGNHFIELCVDDSNGVWVRLCRGQTSAQVSSESGPQEYSQ
jgi:tRNA-splicing ligase RtcB (3'-phosphate/5'-hydroxy nucleic acid ligase)